MDLVKAIAEYLEHQSFMVIPNKGYTKKEIRENTEKMAKHILLEIGEELVSFLERKENVDRQ